MSKIKRFRLESSFNLVDKQNPNKHKRTKYAYFVSSEEKTFADLKQHLQTQEQKFAIFCKENPGKWLLRWRLTEDIIVREEECVQEGCVHQIIQPCDKGNFSTTEILNICEKYFD